MDTIEAVSSDPPQPNTEENATNALPAISEEKSEEAASETPDLSKIAAGTFNLAIFNGVPVDAAKRFLLARAGVKPQHPVHDDLRPLGLAWRPAQDAKGAAVEPDVPRLPSPFSVEGYPGALMSIADWLAAFDAVARP